MSIFENLFNKNKKQEEITDANKRPYEHPHNNSRVAPNHITYLESNEYFVFGSNVSGIHGGGAAAYAMRQFGAIYGQGEGLQGQCYAIPTMEGIDNMRKAINRFTLFASEHPELRFLVTRIGCGIAGYKVEQVAPMFIGCIELQNVALPFAFWKELGIDVRD